MRRMLVMLLCSVPCTATAQTSEHPLEVACAPGRTPEVTKTIVRFGFERTVGDTITSQALAERLARSGWQPTRLDPPPLMVWAPGPRNAPVPALTYGFKVVWDADGGLVELVKGGGPGRYRETVPALLAAIDSTVRRVFPPSVRAGDSTRVRHDSASVFFAARATPVPGAVVLGEMAVSHLVPGEEAQILRFPQPAYPDEMRADDVQGDVQLSYIVRPDSTTTGIVVAAATNPAFAREAVASARRARVSPATAGGCRVSTLVGQRVRFVLQD